jgi:hypothetical protein
LISFIIFDLSKQTNMKQELTELKNYKTLGYTTDFNICDCCGKENLAGTVSMAHIESGIVSHFGTTCAASIEKYDTLDAAKAAKKEINKAVNTYKELARFGWGVAWKMLRKKYGPNAVNIAPKEEWQFLTTDAEKFYTNPENKWKAYKNPHYL